MRTHDGGAAFPRPASEDTSGGSMTDGDRLEDAQVGMTLRDYFAGRAIDEASRLHQATLTQFAAYDEVAVARRAYRIADAMLAERAR